MQVYFPCVPQEQITFSNKKQIIFFVFLLWQKTLNMTQTKWLFVFFVLSNNIVSKQGSILLIGFVKQHCIQTRWLFVFLLCQITLYPNKVAFCVFALSNTILQHTFTPAFSSPVNLSVPSSINGILHHKSRIHNTYYTSYSWWYSISLS